jgi:hypothetical protein
MREAIISTKRVRATPDGSAAEVIAALDAGEIVPGMFLHIPLNGLLAVTFRISEIVSLGDKQIRLTLDCDNDPEVVLLLNFEEETLWALESGED